MYLFPLILWEEGNFCGLLLLLLFFCFLIKLRTGTTSPRNKFRLVLIPERRWNYLNNAALRILYVCLTVCMDSSTSSIPLSGNEIHPHSQPHTIDSWKWSGRFLSCSYTRIYLKACCKNCQEFENCLFSWCVLNSGLNSKKAMGESTAPVHRNVTVINHISNSYANS